MNGKSRYLLKLSLLMSVPIILSEYLFRTSITAVLRWMIENPLIFLVNLSFLVGITLLLGFCFGKLYRSIWFVLIASLILGVLNGNKINLRSVPFQPKDLFLVREFLVLTPTLLTPRYISIVLLGGPLLYGAYRLMKKWFGEHSYKDIKTSAISTLVICLALFLIGEGLYGEDYGPWKLGFIYSLPRAMVEEDPDTSMGWEDLEKELVDEESSEEASEKPELKDQDPNVIIIMSESFWDINHLDAEFSPNPIQNFDSLKEESIHGEIYTPVFGGGTANMEFEVLTGISLKTYPADWHIVYRNNLEDPVPSLASIFKEQGYNTQALHPYYHWYYRRDEVYQLFGFDNFTAIEEMEDSPTIGPYVSDEYVTDEIIRQMDESEDPLFNFTVTMQNHGPYKKLRNEPIIDIQNNLDQEQETMLQTYADGLYYSDQALKKLVDYLKDSDEPTLLLFFGDHLPMMGDNYHLYRELGFIGKDEEPEALQDDLRLYSVPYLLWANYSLEEEEVPLKNATSLPLMVLDQAGIEKPVHLQIVEEIHDRAPLIQNMQYTDENGEIYSQESQEYQEIMEIYRTLKKQIAEPPENRRPAQSFKNYFRQKK